MQFKGKLINQTCENGEKPILGPILACLAQMWTQKFFSCVLPLLDVRHCRKLPLSAISRKTRLEKRIIQTQENGEKPHFGPDLGPPGPSSGCQILFSKI